MKEEYDLVVIGAGHNGLATAALAAKAGRKTIVFEKNAVPGGMAAEDEFHPGYKTPGLFHDTSRLFSGVVDQLNLAGHGLTVKNSRPPLLVLNEKEPILLSDDPNLTGVSLAKTSPKDADRYREYRAFLNRVKGVVRNLLENAPPNLDELAGRDIWSAAKSAIGLRRLGGFDMMELYRAVPISVADWLNEWFESDGLKAALAWNALAGAFAGPMSPGTNISLLFHECLSDKTVVGGGPALVSALVKAAESHGVEIMTDTAVREVTASNGRVMGVVLENGEKVRAKAVAGSCDPRLTILHLLQPDCLTPTLRSRMSSYRGMGMMSKMHLAVDGSVEFTGAEGRAVEFARLGYDLTTWEKAFDDAKYGRIPEKPPLDVMIPTVSRPESAPAGNSVVSVMVSHTPFDLKEGWTKESREMMSRRVIEALEPQCPGLSGRIKAYEFLSPTDIGEKYGLVNGDVNHGDPALDQLIFRPTPDCSGGSTPISGLYLCGGGNHPGGGITAGPAFLAAGKMV